VAPRGGVIAPGGGGRQFAQPGGGGWQGGGTWQGRRHFRGGPSFGVVVPGPYYDDYATPYAYGDDDCYELRFVRGAYRRVWVCE